MAKAKKAKKNVSVKKPVKVAKPIKKTKISAPKEEHKCVRCGRFFKSRLALKRHSTEHLKALKDMQMLRDGQLPEESKLGEGFKGKNKIIIG
jgi:hypothetical protein